MQWLHACRGMASTLLRAHQESHITMLTHLLERKNLHTCELDGVSISHQKRFLLHHDAVVGARRTARRPPCRFRHDQRPAESFRIILSALFHFDKL